MTTREQYEKLYSQIKAYNTRYINPNRQYLSDAWNRIVTLPTKVKRPSKASIKKLQDFKEYQKTAYQLIKQKKPKIKLDLKRPSKQTIETFDYITDLEEHIIQKRTYWSDEVHESAKTRVLRTYYDYALKILHSVSEVRKDLNDHIARNMSKIIDALDGVYWSSDDDTVEQSLSGFYAELTRGMKDTSQLDDINEMTQQIEDDLSYARNSKAYIDAEVAELEAMFSDVI